MEVDSEVIREILRKHWVHSYEEDTESEMVFRPATYPFPPSRGRKSFELKPDGTLVEVGIGPTDRRQQTQAMWRLEGVDTIVFFESGRAEPKRVFRIASVAKDRLAVRK